MLRSQMPERLADREPEQSAFDTRARIRRARARWLPAHKIADLLFRLGHARPAARACTALPQLLQTVERGLAVEPAMNQITADRHPGAADTGTAMHVDAPIFGEIRLDRRDDV